MLKYLIPDIFVPCVIGAVVVLLIPYTIFLLMDSDKDDWPKIIIGSILALAVIIVLGIILMITLNVIVFVIFLVVAILMASSY